MSLSDSERLLKHVNEHISSYGDMAFICIVNDWATDRLKAMGVSKMTFDGPQFTLTMALKNEAKLTTGK